jgi:hypothetical protein
VNPGLYRAEGPGSSRAARRADLMGENKASSSGRCDRRPRCLKKKRQRAAGRRAPSPPLYCSFAAPGVPMSVDEQGLLDQYQLAATSLSAAFLNWLLRDQDFPAAADGH